MYYTMYFPMYSPLPRHPPAAPQQSPARPRRQAPAITRVWLPADPRPDCSLDLLVWGVLGASLLSALLLKNPFLLLLAGTLLVGLAAAHVLVAAARRQASKPARAISRAIRAVEDGEHPRRVLDAEEGWHELGSMAEENADRVKSPVHPVEEELIDSIAGLRLG